MKRFILAVFSMMALVSTSNASVVVNIAQVGNDVVATGSGSFNLGALTSNGNFPASPRISALTGVALIGSGPASSVYGSIVGPTSFGGGSPTSANFYSGDRFGIWGAGHFIFVPNGYTSGTLLNATATWTNKNFTTLGITPGTYTWTWGSGGNADSFTLATVPEPSTYVLLSIALGAVGFARKKMARQA